MVIPRLYWWIYKTWRLSPLVIEHSVVVMSAKLNPVCSQFFDSDLMKFLFRISESESVQNFVSDPSWDSGTAARVQLPLEWNKYLLFNADIVNFAPKSNQGEAESIALLIFVLWWYLNRWWMKGGGMGGKSYFGLAEIAFFSSRDFSQSNKHDTLRHFDVLFL